MCEFCRKFTNHSHPLKNGYDVNIGCEGEVTIDFFNNIVTHIETAGGYTIEASIPIKYCPWCGNALEENKNGNT